MSLGTMVAMEAQIYSFPFATWLRDQKVKRLSKWDPHTLSYHHAKFGGHRCCGSADRGLFIWHVTTYSKGHVLGGWGPPTISHRPAKFCGSRSYGKEDVIFPILILIPVPIPLPNSMFTNGQLKNLYVVQLTGLKIFFHYWEVSAIGR